MRRDLRSSIYPIFATWYTVLVLISGNVNRIDRGSELVTVFVVATAVGLIAWIVGRLLGSDPDGACLISVGLVVCCTSYGWASSLVPVGSRQPGLIVVGLACVFLAIVWLARRTSKNVDRIATIVRATVVIIMVFPLASIAQATLRSDREEQREVGLPTNVVSSLLGTDRIERRPNIYLIILDKYSGSRSLATNYGFDNSHFEEGLRERGFVIPSAARSNYPHTWFTLSSMLNWTFIDEIVEDRPESEWAGAMARAIENNLTWKFLKGIGYEFIFSPSTFDATANNRYADRSVPEPTRSIGVNVFASWIASTILMPILRHVISLAPNASSMFSPSFPYPIESGGEVLDRLRLLADLAGSDGPHFVFAHFLVPHEPYIFHADCGIREPYWPPTDYVDDQAPLRAAYVEQISCVNHLVNQLVDEILTRSPRPPIILLQSDHGHGFIAVNPLHGAQLPLAQLESRQVEERLDVFAAYYLPYGGAEIVYDSITPVNLLPIVFNHYFEAGIPLSDDAHYWARLHPPIELTRLR